MNNKMRILSALLSTCAIPVVAVAQESQGENTQGDQSAPRGIFSDEIVVTANRREENVQDVGLSVSAFSGEQLEALDVRSAGEIAQLAPNVEFKKQWGARGNSSLFYVRGIGQADFNEGSESPTTVYVDDFYVLSNSATDFLLHDVAGAEILRGPQGTLFGRNSTAGAVVVRNNKPGFDFEGNLEVGAGNYQGNSINGMLNIPVVDERLAFRFSMEREQYDGTTRNLYDGPGPGGDDTHAGNFLSLRPQLRWDPTSSLSILYKYQYGWVHARNGGDSSQPMIQVPGDTIVTDADGFGYNPVASGANSTTVIADGVNDFRNVVNHHLLTANLDVTDNVTLTSITGYLKQSKYTLEDCDGTPRTICHAYNTVDQDYWTQEGRIAIDLERANITVGGFYLSLNYANNWVLPIISGSGTFQGNATIQPGDGPGGLVQITPNTSDLTSYAFYGNVAYDLTDKLTLNGGLRWNHEDRDFAETEGLYLHDAPDTGLYTFQGNTFGILALDVAGYQSFLANNVLGAADPVNDPVVSISDNYSDSFIAYQVSLDFKPNEDTLLYVSHKRGMKAGGFNNGLVNFSATALDEIPFAREQNNAYEAGIKWSSPDNRVQINAAGFYYDYKDYQATAFSVTNASLGVQVLNKDATAYGGEVEIFANLADGLDVYVGGGYVDTKVKDVTKVSAGVVDTQDRELGQAPHFQSSGLVRYESNFFDLGILTNQVNYSYLGKRFVDVLNDTATQLPSHWNVDYNVTFEPAALEHWYIAAYVKNVFNDTDATQKFNFASLFQTGQINYFPPRFYGVQVGVRW